MAKDDEKFVSLFLIESFDNGRIQGILLPDFGISPHLIPHESYDLGQKS